MRALRAARDTSPRPPAYLRAGWTPPSPSRVLVETFDFIEVDSGQSVPLATSWVKRGMKALRVSSLHPCLDVTDAKFTSVTILISFALYCRLCENDNLLTLFFQNAKKT